ncbi:unnamed protein product [Symbiodinium sp. CCMP2592]|nr:unnamed protein product [Symbiodinium sp. CCMP2592]
MGGRLSHGKRVEELSKCHPGTRVAAGFEDDKFYHERILLWCAGGTDWVTLTPDYDVYNENFSGIGDPGFDRCKIKGIDFSYWCSCTQNPELPNPLHRLKDYISMRSSLERFSMGMVLSAGEPEQREETQPEAQPEVFFQLHPPSWIGGKLRVAKGESSSSSNRGQGRDPFARESSEKEVAQQSEKSQEVSFVATCKERQEEAKEEEVMDYDKTASGEALRDQGKAEVTGTLPGGRGATITGPGAGFHRVLLSGAQACKTHFAFLHGTGQLLVPKGSAFAKEADEALRKLAWKHRGVATKMQVKNGIYVFPLEDGKKGGLKGESRGQDGLGFTGRLSWLRKPPKGERKQRDSSNSREDAGDDRFAEEPEAPGEEQQRTVVPKSPDQPTADQIAQHEASGHAVHRSWCVHCQRAHKMVNPHYKVRRSELETSLPALHMDYFFLGKDKQEDDVMPHLVVRCDRTQRTWATSQPQKGTRTYNVTWLAGIIREAGSKKMCLFSNNEHALKALELKASEEVKGVEFDLRECPTSTEHGNAPANGVAEAAVREVKRMVRAILSELETRLKIEVGVDHPILAWIARHAALLMSRSRIGEDGKSAYERTLGRPWRRLTIVFGEQVMFKPVGTKHKRGSLENQGFHGTLRWDCVEERGEQPAPLQRDFKARNLYVMKSDIELYGYTPRCPGCDAQLMGKERVKRAQERVERDYGKKVKKDQPALEGRPAPDAMEVAAEEAAGALLSRPMETEESPTRQKREASTGVDELYREAAANPPPAGENAQIGLITRMFEQKGMTCSPAEASSFNWILERRMFTQAEHLRFFEKLEHAKPKLPIGRLPTGPFQSVQRASDTTNKVGAEARRENLKKSRSQLGLCFEAFQAQMEAGNYFLDEWQGVQNPGSMNLLKGWKRTWLEVQCASGKWTRAGSSLQGKAARNAPAGYGTESFLSGSHKLKPSTFRSSKGKCSLECEPNWCLRRDEGGRTRCRAR